MRVEDVITSHGFRFGSLVVEDKTERRVILSERDREQLRSACRLLEKIREAIDPNDWDDIRDNEDLRIVRLAEVYTHEVSTEIYFVVDLEPRMFAINGALTEIEKRSDL